MKHRNAYAMSVISELADRGVAPDRVEDGMVQLVGCDWKGLDATAWLSRLKIKGLVSPVTESLHIDDLEALTRGKIILDDLYWRARHPEVFPITCSCGRTYSRADWPLLHFDGTGWTWIPVLGTAKPDGDVPWVRSLAVVPGGLWGAGANGVARYDGASWHDVPAAPTDLAMGDTVAVAALDASGFWTVETWWGSGPSGYRASSRVRWQGAGQASAIAHSLTGAGTFRACMIAPVPRPPQPTSAILISSLPAPWAERAISRATAWTCSCGGGRRSFC